MKYYQYLRVHHDIIHDEVMDEYSLNIEPNGHVYFKIRRGMYGFK